MITLKPAENWYISVGTSLGLSLGTQTSHRRYMVKINGK